MFYQTEAKLQAWRALAVMTDRTERLIFVGRSTTQVREGYVEAFAELFDEEERAQVQSIELQCWHGAADLGHWVQKSTLPIPTVKPAGHILPFRRPTPETVEAPPARLAQAKPLAPTA
jgi:hypothetical protein